MPISSRFRFPDPELSCPMQTHQHRDGGPVLDHAKSTKFNDINGSTPEDEFVGRPYLCTRSGLHLDDLVHVQPTAGNAMQTITDSQATVSQKVGQERRYFRSRDQKRLLRQQDRCVQPGDLFCTSTKLSIELVLIHVADLAPELWTCIRKRQICKPSLVSST